MTWRVQSAMEGPLNIADMSLVFMKGQIKDLDLIGRENAERSSDIKLSLLKGWLRELEKTPYNSSSLSTEVVNSLTQTAQKTNDMIELANQTVVAQTAIIAKLEAKINQYEEDAKRKDEQQAEILDKTHKILEQIKEFNEKDPIRLRTIAETLRNIQSERKDIKEKIETLKEEEITEGTIATQQKILNLKDKKLEKNLDNLGKSVSKESNSVNETLNALDELGI